MSTGAEDVLWTSSDTNVATVDDTGLVTAGIPGTATITVTTADGSQGIRGFVTAALAETERRAADAAEPENERFSEP